ACADDGGLTATQRPAARAVRLLHDLYGYEARELVDLRIARIDEARRVDARALRVGDLLVELGDLACERIDLSDGRQALLRDRSTLIRPHLVRAAEALRQRVVGRDHLLAQRRRGRVWACVVRR